MNKESFERIVRQLQTDKKRVNLTNNQKLELTRMVLGEDECEDNSGQILFYSGLREDKNGKLRRLR